MSLGGSEILVIAVLALMLLGPDKLPGALKMFGRAMGEIRKYQNLAKSEIDKAVASAETFIDEKSISESETTAPSPQIEIKPRKSSSKTSKKPSDGGIVDPILDEDDQ